MFHITASNVLISNLSIISTVATESTRGIYFDGSLVGSLTECDVSNVYFACSGSTGSNTPIVYATASGTVRNCVGSSVASGATNAYGIYLSTGASATETATVNCYNCDFTTSVISGSNCIAYICATSSSGYNSILNLYNCRGYATGTASRRSGAATFNSAYSIINAENCVFQGDDYDVLRYSSGGGLTLKNCTLVNNTTSGTISYSGTTVTNGLLVASSSTPASASATGTTGQICWDSSYVYVCVATNTWKRSALSSW
jgi:hypothetical protein